MPKVVVVTRSGEEWDIDGVFGCSVMQIIRDAGFDELLALCGGACSCATCHVHVDPAFADKLPPMGIEESELLDSSESRDAWSRLSCQLPFRPGMEGLRVQIAEED